MNETTTRLLGALLAGLALAACEQAPPATAGMPEAGADTATAPFERNLDPRQVARGQGIYAQHCTVCHGPEGKGMPGNWRIRDAQGRYPPPPLDDSAHAWHHPTAVLLQAVREGSPEGEGNMPAWKGTLSEQEIQDVVAYIKSLWSDPVYRLWWKIEQQSLED